MITKKQHQEWKKDLIELHEVKTENKKLQKQKDLLNLCLLKEKNKYTALLFAWKFAKAHIKKNAHKKALPILRAAIAKAE